MTVLLFTDTCSTFADLFKYRLINCKLINSTFLHNKEGCLLSDVSDENNAYMVYFVSFLGTLAVLPGNIVSALLMDKIGRLRMLGKTENGTPICSICSDESIEEGERASVNKSLTFDILNHKCHSPKIVFEHFAFVLRFAKFMQHKML